MKIFNHDLSPADLQLSTHSWITENCLRRSVGIVGVSANGRFIAIPTISNIIEIWDYLFITTPILSASISVPFRNYDINIDDWYCVSIVWADDSTELVAVWHNSNEDDLQSIFMQWKFNQQQVSQIARYNMRHSNTVCNS